MKKLFFSTVFFCFLGVVFAQKINNVTIESKIKSEGFEGDIVWHIKGDRIAFDMIYVFDGVSYETRFIPNRSKGVFDLLTNTGGIKMKSSVSAVEIEPAPGFESEIITMEILGEEMVSGILCKKIAIQTPGTYTECLIDTTIDFKYYFYEKFFKSDYALLALKHFKMTGFPISITTKDLQGNVLNKVETVNIRTNSVSDNVFTIGKEYKTFEELNEGLFDDDHEQRAWEINNPDGSKKTK